LRSASVYVVSLREEFISCGQIRVMNAIRNGTPIVATRVIGLEGYLVDGETGVLVNPGDHQALGEAVDSLLQDSHEGQRLAARAFELAADRTFEQYLDRIGGLVQDELASSGSTAGEGRVGY